MTALLIICSIIFSYFIIGAIFLSCIDDKEGSFLKYCEERNIATFIIIFWPIVLYYHIKKIRGTL